jgi:hypothetical protein
MYTFHEINFGMSFNNQGIYADSFLNDCYKLFYENFGCDRIECFDQELLDEIKEEGIDVKPLVNDMLNWMIANNDKLKFSSQYHGSAETTPLCLIFKDYEVDIQHDIYNFTWDFEYLLYLNGKLQEILDFCKQTMSSDLYEYITKNKLLGINFLNASS